MMRDEYALRKDRGVTRLEYSERLRGENAHECEKIMIVGTV